MVTHESLLFLGYPSPLPGHGEGPPSKPNKKKSKQGRAVRLSTTVTPILTFKSTI
jgi:hypothetical protein